MCDEAFGTPATFADLQELVAREAWPSYFAPVIDSETSAIQIHEWELRVVPGLLQTEDYARSVIRAGQPRISADELERKVSSRLERQAIFARPSGRPMYWAVIHEGVLRHVIGSPEIMRGQLGRLADAADSPDIITSKTDSLPATSCSTMDLPRPFVMIRTLRRSRSSQNGRSLIDDFARPLSPCSRIPAPTIPAPVTAGSSSPSKEAEPLSAQRSWSKLPRLAPKA